MKWTATVVHLVAWAVWIPYTQLLDSHSREFQLAGPTSNGSHILISAITCLNLVEKFNVTIQGKEKTSKVPSEGFILQKNAGHQLSLNTMPHGTFFFLYSLQNQSNNVQQPLRNGLTRSRHKKPLATHPRNQRYELIQKISYRMVELSNYYSIYNQKHNKTNCTKQKSMVLYLRSQLACIRTLRITMDERCIRNLQDQRSHATSPILDLNFSKHQPFFCQSGQFLNLRDGYLTSDPSWVIKGMQQGTKSHT